MFIERIEDVNIKPIYTPNDSSKHLLPGEIDSLCRLVTLTKPKMAIEIGTGWGQTTLAIFRNMIDGKLYTIDNKEKPIGIDIYDKEVEKPLGCLFKDKGYARNITQFLGNSKDFDYESIKPIDFAFIDGSHNYDDVLLDTKNILSVSKKGTTIVWHGFNDAKYPDVNKVIKIFTIRMNIKFYYINNTSLLFVIL